MFYILLSLQEELCGADVMSRVENLTDGRVTVGPGTLYHLLDEFLTAGMIEETKAEGRRRSYRSRPPDNRLWRRNTAACGSWSTEL